MAGISDEDIFGGRTVISYGSACDRQEAPRRDNRYRVNDSVRFYVVQLCGTWVNVTETAQRSLKRKNRQSYVRFEGLDYQLRPANQFRDVLKGYAKYGADIHLLGMEVTDENVQDVEPWPFIWIAPKAAQMIFRAYFINRDMEEWERLRAQFRF